MYGKKVEKVKIISHKRDAHDFNNQKLVHGSYLPRKLHGRPKFGLFILFRYYFIIV